MKRFGNLYDKFSSQDTLTEAANNAIRGKKRKKKKQVQIFINDRENKLNEVKCDLLTKNFNFGPLYSFEVTEHKKRIIDCPRFFPDRIYQQSIMAILKPLFIRHFTADTYASINGKGKELCKAKVERAINNHAYGYYLQVDVHHFFQSIDKDILKQKIRRLVKDKDALAFIDADIDSNNEGIAIGKYTSSYYANYYMSELDHKIKEVYHVRYYFRYMDDELMLFKTKEECHQMLAILKQELAAIGLSLKSNVRIAPTSYGIDFLGYVFYPKKIRVRRRIVISMKAADRRLRKMNVPDRYYKRIMASYWSWCKQAGATGLFKSILKDKIYLFDKQMAEYKKLSDFKPKDKEYFFGLTPADRVSIDDLYNIELVFFDAIKYQQYDEKEKKMIDKVVVRFAYPIDDTRHHLFISRSMVLLDRFIADKEHMPFKATLKKHKIKNYAYYE